MASYKLEITLPKITMVGPGKMSKAKMKKELKSILMAETDLIVKQIKVKNLKP